MELQFITLMIALELVDGFGKFYMEERCGETLKMDIYGDHAGRLKPSRRSIYRPNINCVVTIKTAPSHQFVVVFKKLSVEFEPFCDDDYLQLFDGNSTRDPIIRGLPRKLCGHEKPGGSYITSGRTLTLLFHTDSWANENGFEILITIFHTGECVEGEFRCMNKRCIASHLKCDGINNCGDRSDECRLTADTVLAVIASVIVVTFLGIGFITLIRRRSKTKIKKKREMNENYNNKLHDHIHEKYQRSLSVDPLNEHMDIAITRVQTAEGLPW